VIKLKSDRRTISKMIYTYENFCDKIEMSAMLVYL